MENRLLTYGTENYHYSKATEFVANNWNIEIYRVAGTSVRESILDSVRVKNSEFWKKLDEIKKTDSQQLFRKEVVAEMNDILKAQKLFDTDRKVKRLINKIENSKTNSFSELETKIDDGIYLWTIYSREIHPDFPRISIAEFNVEINIKTNEIKIVPVKKN